MENFIIIRVCGNGEKMKTRFEFDHLNQRIYSNDIIKIKNKLAKVIKVEHLQRKPYNAQNPYCSFVTVEYIKPKTLKIIKN